MNVTLGMICDALAAFAPAMTGGGEVPPVFDTVKLLGGPGEAVRAGTLYVAAGRELEDYLREGEGGPGQRAWVVCVAGPDWTPPESDSFELLVIPDRFPFSQVFNRIQELFGGMMRWDMELDRIIYAGRPLQEMIDVSEPMFTSPLLLWDATFHVRAYSRRLGPDHGVLEKIIEEGIFPTDLIQKIISRGHLANREHQNCLRVLHDGKSGSCYYMWHYFLKGRRNYSAAMATVNGAPTVGELDRLRYFFKKLGEYLENQSEQDLDFHNLYEAFLQDLLDGTLVGEEEIAERANAFGIPFRQGYVMYNIEFERFSKPQAEFIIYSLRQTLPKERFIIRGESVCLLKAVDAYSCDKEEARARFTSLLATYHAYCGLSRIFPSLAECRTAYAQARAASRLGRQLSGAKTREELGSRIFFYRDYAVYHMLELCEKEIDLFSLLPRRLARFYEAERIKGGGDVDLLMAFMESGMSVSATAQNCYLHRNSVAYRIRRIEEQLKLDLSNMESVLNVLLLLKIMRYLDRDE